MYFDDADISQFSIIISRQSTIILALSSGVVFGNVLTGTAVSVVCSTLASSVNFFLARTALREKTQKREIIIYSQIIT